MDQAKAYVLGRLARLDPNLTYHSIAHTRDDVVPAASRLAALEGVTGEDRLLLLTAAWFHDIGFVEQITDHELIGIRVAREMLPSWGYTPEQIEVISNIILTTRLPQNPQTLLEAMMADADLDVLGREDYVTSQQALRQEMAIVNGIPHTDREWYLFQQEFLSKHVYFTDAAHTLRDAGQARNLALVRTWLAGLPEP